MNNDLKRWLDNGWTLAVFKNEMTSYTAVLVGPGEEVDDAVEDDDRISDSFEPDEAIIMLCEKAMALVRRKT